MAWIADLEEQDLIAGLAKNSCPACEADFDSLGLNHAQRPRTGNEIVAMLKNLRQQYPSADTWQFVNLAKEHGLVGTKRLCWEGLPTDISDVICVDLLHGVHKMFTDHVLKWLKATLGKEQLDRRFIAQPYEKGKRNFPQGFQKSHSGQVVKIAIWNVTSSVSSREMKVLLPA